MPPSTAPCPEFRNHYQLDAPRIDAAAFQPAWRIKTHLAALVEAGHIDRAEFEAGLLWRRWVRDPRPAADASWSIRVDRKNAADMTENELAAAAKLRAAATAVGPERTELLLLLIVDDWRWAAICALAGMKDPKTVKDRCAEALAALASWLAGRPRRTGGPIAGRGPDDLPHRAAAGKVCCAPIAR